MAHLRRAGFMLRRSFIQKLSQDWNSNVLPVSPSLYILSRGMAASKLFVGGLAWATDEATLRNAFSPYGNLTEVKIITDRDTGRSRGFGFVGFTSDAEAESALQAMDGQSLAGRVIRVNYANVPGAGRTGGINLALGGGRGGSGGSFGSIRGVGRESAYVGSENVGFGLKEGGFASEGGGFGNYARLGNEDGSFGGPSGVSVHERRHLGLENFSSKGGDFDVRESDYSRNYSGLGLQGGGLGQQSGDPTYSGNGYGQDLGAVRPENRLPGRNSEGFGTQGNDSARNTGRGFGGSPVDLGPHSMPSCNSWRHQNDQYANPNYMVDTSSNVGTNGWRGVEHAGINNEEGFPRRSGSLDYDTSSSADWAASPSEASGLASSGDWRGTNSQNIDPSSANWRSFSKGSSNDMTGSSLNSLHDKNKALDGENSPYSDSWRDADYGSNPYRGQRDY